VCAYEGDAGEALDKSQTLPADDPSSSGSEPPVVTSENVSNNQANLPAVNNGTPFHLCTELLLINNKNSQNKFNKKKN
jgi:hypothetical protein